MLGGVLTHNFWMGLTLPGALALLLSMFHPLCRVTSKKIGLAWAFHSRKAVVVTKGQWG